MGWLGEEGYWNHIDPKKKKNTGYGLSDISVWSISPALLLKQYVEWRATSNPLNVTIDVFIRRRMFGLRHSYCLERWVIHDNLTQLLERTKGLTHNIYSSRFLHYDCFWSKKQKCIVLECIFKNERWATISYLKLKFFFFSRSKW